MSLPTYSSVKRSRASWIGDIPSHWQEVRLKFGLRLITEKASDDRPKVALENIESWTGRFLRSDTEFEGDGTAFVRGDILFGKLRPYLAKALLAEAEGQAVGDFHVLRPNSELNARFALYYLLSRDFISVVDGSTYGAKMPRASWEFMSNLPLPLPPLPEQTAIAAFLDRETGKIDALVEEQRRLIELLKEKRQAVISHAVTKGLNPNVRMKPSGVEWLGDVPEHWEVKRLKFVATIQTGTAKGKDLAGQQTVCVPYLRVANVQDGYLDLSDVAEIEVPIADLKRYLLQAGDVLMNEGGDFDKLGRGAVWDGSIDPCIHQNHVFAVRPYSVLPQWLNFVTSSASGRHHFMVHSKQSTNLASISSTNLMELPLAVPPCGEQRTIISKVQEHLRELGSLETLCERSILLLQERRTALISAAVTGKIDLRNVSGLEEAA